MNVFHCVKCEMDIDQRSTLINGPALPKSGIKFRAIVFAIQLFRENIKNMFNSRDVLILLAVANLFLLYSNMYLFELRKADDDDDSEQGSKFSSDWFVDSPLAVNEI